ncbi:hypothetical protein [Sporolactobacillus inulinus]|uniref:DNA replication protein DnaC n=1 Tax=Sporolactobacillus inulinus TaxID=2078 RepID=A0A4Y3TA09_9BACL|nr:hypothetical protein [Sporolactobacillus inulinus]GAY75586.1 DNA replication protein DnaC [Sporolactobacillus inulinus]GEB78584.1 hypothetical protein SIN01_29290 [Sporolactobacillus inulinus]
MPINSFWMGVGAEGITPWTKELMFAILNARLSKSLLVTTNGLISVLSQLWFSNYQPFSR